MIAHASHIGRSHQRVLRNNQDGVFIDDGVLVVTDGCSSQPFSETGALLGARFLGSWLSTQRDLAGVHARATDALCEWIADSARPLGGSVAEAVERYFLFTFLAAVVRGDECVVFGMGDGQFLIDDACTRLDSGPENAPNYCAYRLFDGAAAGPTLHFSGVATRISVMTDGLDVLDGAQLQALLAPGLSKNQHTLQRRLNVLGENGRFSDDATLAIWER